MTANRRLTILFRNRPSPAGLTSLWGFAALIETGERTLLFDTGSNGRVLLKNMAALGLSMASVDQLFLSHPHWYHMVGALAARDCCEAGQFASALASDPGLLRAAQKAVHSLTIPVAATDSADAFGPVTGTAHRVIHSGCGIVAAGG